MIEGAGGVEVPKALFYVLIRCGGDGQPETHKRKVEK